MKIDRKMLRNWIKVKNEFLSVENRRKRARLDGGGCRPLYPLLDAALKIWFDGERKPSDGGRPRQVSWRRFRNKAMELIANPQMNAATCKVSDRYIGGFMRRNKLSMRNITHQALEDNRPVHERQQVARLYLEAVKVKTIGLDSAHIINMDETPVYVDMASNRTMSYSGRSYELKEERKKGRIWRRQLLFYTIL